MPTPISGYALSALGWRKNGLQWEKGLSTIKFDGVYWTIGEQRFEFIHELPEQPTTIAKHHETTKIEYQIPKEIEDELSIMIEQRIWYFERKCQCENCKAKNDKK